MSDTQLRDEVGRIVDTTEFNGSKVLKPGDGDKPIQIFVGASNRGADAAGNLPDIDKDNDPDVLTIKLDELQGTGGPPQLGSTTGFEKKSNRGNKIFLTIIISVALVLIAALFWVLVKGH